MALLSSHSLDKKEHARSVEGIRPLLFANIRMTVSVSGASFLPGDRRREAGECGNKVRCGFGTWFGETGGREFLFSFCQCVFELKESIYIWGEWIFFFVYLCFFSTNEMVSPQNQLIFFSLCNLV